MVLLYMPPIVNIESEINSPKLFEVSETSWGMLPPLLVGVLHAISDFLDFGLNISVIFLFYLLVLEAREAAATAACVCAVTWLCTNDNEMN